MSDGYAELSAGQGAADEHRGVELRHRFLADSASDVVWSMALDGRITYISPAVERVRGLTPDEAMQQPLNKILTPESSSAVVAYLNEVNEDVKAGRHPKNFRDDLEYYREDGSTFWTEVLAYPLIGADGSCVEIIGVTRDISARKRREQELERAREEAERAKEALASANAKLQRLATTDDLTGAANRRYFEEALEAELTRARRYGEPVSLIMFDIDHFKKVNDRFGHQTGDITLAELSRLVSMRLRSLDILARWGGEEFMVMMPHCRAADATRLAERLRSMIAEHKFPIVSRITVSLGVTELRPDDRPEDALKRVDDAMYQAKAHGRNKICQID